MELRHLRYFHAVAETLSFSRAAERLHIAQPPLSRQIRQLEEALGVELIDRESRPIALTAAGKFYYEQTLQVLSRLREPMMAALPGAHPLVGRDTVSLDALAQESLVVHPARPRPGYADQVLDLFARRGMRPAGVSEANEIQTALGLVAAGIGVALVPASACQDRRGSVVFRNVEDADAVSPVIMNFRRGDESAVLGRFRTMARALLPRALSGVIP